MHRTRLKERVCTTWARWIRRLTPRGDISEFAPRIHTIKINPDKIKDVIGKGGSVIRALTEETGTTIEIEDDGTVKIAATDGDKAQHAIRRIEEITAEIEVGRIYNGKVTRIVDFGAFVAIGGGKEGLVHISQIADKRVEKVTTCRWVRKYRLRFWKLTARAVSV